MKTLIVNCGSSSLKYDLIDLFRECSLWSGMVGRIGLEGSTHEFGQQGQRLTQDVVAETHGAALEIVLASLVRTDGGPLRDLSEIGAVAHRVGHGGRRYRSAVVIDLAEARALRLLAALGLARDVHLLPKNAERFRIRRETAHPAAVVVAA